MLVDIVEGVPQGKILNRKEASPVEKHDTRLISTDSYEDTKDSVIVINHRRHPAEGRAFMN